ncbi:transmembrane protein 134 isoform X2 [Myotis myotis]|uniref:transmembrane protein 134 isoform X2 n=1 Tax=Myotis myotis TaxID=51298 RepID=UPI001747F867|nr:transmembrane protein 134 isoform X2 [Myotis myotis]
MLVPSRHPSAQGPAPGGPSQPRRGPRPPWAPPPPSSDVRKELGSPSVPGPDLVHVQGNQMLWQEPAPPLLFRRLHPSAPRSQEPLPTSTPSSWKSPFSQNLENDEEGTQVSPEPDGGVNTSSQWSFSTISNSTQRSYNACCSWTQHPLIQKNRKVVLASFLLLLLGLVLILVGVGLEVAPSPGVSSAIFFVPGFLLLVPGVYHVIFIYCAVKGHRGFQFFYLPYFEK